ncbi:MAG: C1 family peptidase [Candidatus Pacebacteria bacterium]|nr:C1 family peptidase [Candidatus Paceibacterota bacterium]
MIMNKNWFIAIVFSLILIIEIILITQFGLKTIDFNILQGSISNNPVINVTYPSGGEVLSIGSSQYIRWNSSGVNKVTIYLCAELPGMVCSEIYGIPVNGIDARLGEYKYTVPKVDVFSNNQEVIIKIFDAESNYKIYGQSKKFTISDKAAENNITAKGGTTSSLNKVSISKTFSKSSSVYKFQAKLIYSLYVSGSRTISKTDGYARIILIDKNGKQYLVYEAIGPYDSKTSDFDRSCQEACSLNGITPKELKVEVSGASIKINDIFIAEDKNSVLTAKSAQQSSSEKLSKIQEYIRKNNLGWTAGETSVSRMSYEQKRKLLGVIDGKEMPNMQGFEYYKGGVFEIGNNKTTSKSASSNLPSSFDWRNRHGENWLTSVKNQGPMGSCWAFGATGAVEAVANLYYNQHLDIDLSEQDLVSCSSGGPLEYYNNKGIVMEKCFPYQAEQLPCNNKCKGVEKQIVIKIGAPGEYIGSRDEEKLKKELITKGPLSAGIGSWNHAMVLVGWETEAKYNAPVWIFKNSWGENYGENGYVKIVTSERYEYSDLGASSIGLPITINNYQPLQIECVDEDKDNYCNWGISEKKPSTCSKSCKLEKDCDDSNSQLGPFDRNLNCTKIGATNDTEPIIKDNTPPIITNFQLSILSLENAIKVEEEFSFLADVTDDIGAVACEMKGLPAKEIMKLICQKNTCWASLKYSFTKKGSYSTYIECQDLSGNTSKSGEIKINVIQKCPDCRDQYFPKFDYCEDPPVCSKDCGADAKCDRKSRSGWIDSDGNCNACDHNCSYKLYSANLRHCKEAKCTEYGWSNSQCWNYTYHPCYTDSCISKSSCGYIKGKKTVYCANDEYVVSGQCIPMPGNKVIKSTQVDNGWYCEFRCKFPICFVSDGCAFVSCAKWTGTF